jgi:hypothetical protein
MIWMKLSHEAGAILVTAAFVFSPALIAGQTPPPQPPSARATEGRPPSGFPDLVGALKSTPGCVGVEVARTGSGKQVIFAWFEDKKAALNWYYSETHQAAMKQFFPQSQGSKRTPMKDVADDSGPVMAIASITMADKAPGDITTLPISQIAIELYTPLPGGLALGGRFAPPAIKVPGMRESALPGAPKTDRER